MPLLTRLLNSKYSFQTWWGEDAYKYSLVVLGDQWNHPQRRSSLGVRGMEKAVLFRWEGSVMRAVSLTVILETAAGQLCWGPCKYMTERWVHSVQPMLGRSYSREYYTLLLDHFYCRTHFFPWPFPGSGEKGEEPSVWVRTVNGFGLLLLKVFIASQGEWNRSNFRINFLF